MTRFLERFTRVRLRNSLARRLTAVGERWGWESLIYNHFTFCRFHEFAVESAPAVMDAFAAAFPAARRYADIGAGTGGFAIEAIRRGLYVEACEYSNKARKMAQRIGVASRPFDLAHAPPARLDGPFDLAYCFEVAEHIPPAMGITLVEFLIKTAPVVVFTAAHPNQGGSGHINEQPQDYWIEHFERSGAKFNRGKSEEISDFLSKRSIQSHWLVTNMMVFER